MADNRYVRFTYEIFRYLRKPVRYDMDVMEVSVTAGMMRREFKEETTDFVLCFGESR